MPSNAQVFELAADHRDLGFLFAGKVLGIEPADNAICGDNIEEVQSFKSGGDKRVVAIVVFLVTTGNVRVAGLKGDELAILEILDARTAVTADDWKCAGSLN